MRDALKNIAGALTLLSLLAITAASARAQALPPPDEFGPPPGAGGGFPPEFGGGPRPFGPGGPPGFGGVQAKRELVKTYDKDGDQRLNAAERKAALTALAKDDSSGRGRRRMGPPWGRSRDEGPVQPGPKLTPAEVQPVATNLPLYSATVLRTLFLDFENNDWEKELMAFHNTDVEVPARLTVDGKTYPDVGVHFRGASSFMMVSEGRKHSLNLALDFAHEDQRLFGYRTLNLLNSHTDGTFLRTVLYNQIAREYIPAPKANFVRVVINGECWGIYVNAQQFNKDFAKEWFGNAKGARWKVPGSPFGHGGLDFIGEEMAAYKKLYEIKTKDDPASWKALIELCRVLNQTPADQLEKALASRLDIDGTLKYLALDNTFINNDGYWTRASDYNIYLDEKGVFHIIPHDSNETFRSPEGPGMRGNRESSGPTLSPLAGADDTGKALLNKLLAVPALKARYYGYVRDLAEKWLDWPKLAPIVKQYQDLIAADVKADTRKLDAFDSFARGATEDVEEQGFRGPQRGLSLKNFVEQRRAYLLGLPEIKLAVAKK